MCMALQGPGQLSLKKGGSCRNGPQAARLDIVDVASELVLAGRGQQGAVLQCFDVNAHTLLQVNALQSDEGIWSFRHCIASSAGATIVHKQQRCSPGWQPAGGNGAHESGSVCMPLPPCYLEHGRTHSSLGRRPTVPSRLQRHSMRSQAALAVCITCLLHADWHPASASSKSVSWPVREVREG